MPKLTPKQGAEKLGRAIQTRGQDYIDGINRVTENPMEKAAAASDKWFDGVTEAHNNDRFAKGCRRVSLSDWKGAVNAAGKSAYTGGAAKAQRKYEKFAEDFYPFLEQVQAEVNSMPKRNLQESIAKMVATVEKIAEFANR